MKRLALAPILAVLALAGCGSTAAHHAASRAAVAPTTSTTAPACPGYVTPYGCQAHSPTFGLPPANRPQALPPTSTSTVEMLDTTGVSALAGLHPAAVAGYLNGFWPTAGPLVRAFPRAFHLPITVRSTPIYPGLAGTRKIVCDDIEPGNSSPSTAGPWTRGELALGVTPCDYASLSDMPAVKRSIVAAGVSLSKVVLWDADWTFRPGLDRGYQCTQWTNHVGSRNADESTCALSVFATPAPPKPKPKPKPTVWSSAEIQVQGARPTATVTLRLARGHWTVSGAHARVHSLPYNARPLGG